MRRWKTKLESFFIDLSKDRSGTVAILFAMAIIPVLISIGSAVDLGRSFHTRSVMQGAADAAVLAAALSGEIGDAQEQVVEKSFELNLDSQIAAQFTGPPSAEVTINDGIISLQASAHVKTTLLGLHRESVFVSVVSKAQQIEGGPACIVSLDPSAEDALSVSGTADINTIGCGIQVNSNHPQSITQSGSGSVNVPNICTRGGFSGSFNTRPRRCPPLQDPLRQMVEAAIASEMPGSGSNSPTIKKNSERILQPGLYRGTLRVQAHGYLGFEPGIYFIENGDFEVWANSVVHGDGVTIVFTGDRAGGVEIRSGSDVVLSASTSGPFEGLLFVQDPNATPKDSESILIGGGNLELTGTIYMPLHELTITGSGEISADSPQFAIIAKTISLKGNGQLNINMDTDYDAAGYDELPGVVSSAGVILIE